MPRPAIDPIRRHIGMTVPESDYQELMQAANRMGLRMAEVIRRSIKAYLLSTLAYYYVRLEGGQYMPPAADPGFLNFEEARKVAALKHGIVVQRRWEPAS